MIIVSGKLYVVDDRRQDFLDRSSEAMILARDTPGCRDFVVSADPIESDRVNIFEEWESEKALEAFRGSGPPDDMSALIVRADISQREVE